MVQSTPAAEDFDTMAFYQATWPASLSSSGDEQMAAPSPHVPTSRTVSRLQLSRLFRRSRSVKSKSEGVTRNRSRTRPSVTNMRTPFPLLLPDSPSAIDGDSLSSAGFQCGLRKMPASYNDLRSLAQPRTTLSPLTPLLPSPISKDFPRESDSFFKFHTPREHPSTLPSNEDDLDSCDILSYYCNDFDDETWHPDKKSVGGQYSDQEVLEDDSQSTASESMPVTPTEQEIRPACCTDESDWLANTTSHDQRMQRFTSRYYQVVQQPWTKIDTEDDENKVMIATVLIGPGKPKLVQIPRPPSSQARTETPIKDPLPPSTPKQEVVEVSAFSPYDTPYEAPSQIDSLIADPESPPPEDLPTGLVPRPLAFLRRSRSSRSDSIFSTWQRFHDLVDPFELSPRRARSDRSFRGNEKRWAIRGTSEMPLRSLQATSPTTKSATWSRCRRLERTITAVTQAIDDFPADLLQLDSPAVRELRNPQVPEQTYMEALRRIFPAAPSLLLSSLTAWMIIDMYFTRLKEQPVPGVAERLLAQMALSNDSLHRIPDKAREMLGIGLPDEATMRINEHALRRKAASIQASIAVVEQRLVEALRGSWEEDVWRSLKVLVELIESSPRPWT